MVHSSTNIFVSYFKLFRLSDNRIPDTVLQAELLNVVDLNAKGRYEIKLSGDFIILYAYGISVLVVMDWKTNRKTEFHVRYSSIKITSN